MKKILFVVLPYAPDKELQTKHKLRSFFAHPYGVLSIATYLKRNTTAIAKVFDCNIKDNLLDEITRFNPDIIALSMMFDCSYKNVEPMCKEIKDWNSKVIIVIGGAAAAGNYQTMLDTTPEIDAVCYGEGELAFADLIRCGELRYKSWATRTNPNPVREYIVDLDEVIDIDYSFINPSDYPMKESFSPFASKKPCHKQFFIVTTRGCVFDCSFCCNSANPDKTMRYASVDRIIDHVQKLVDTYGMTVLTFYDDQLLFNKKRAKELFRKLISFNLRIECPNGLSVAFIDDELAGLMKAAGMDTVNLAIESGSSYVLNELIRKPLHVEQVQPVIDILRKYNFWINMFTVLGMPGETDEHRQETKDAIKRWGLDWACITNACPVRGSGLYKLCIEKGYIPNDMAIDELDMNKFIISTPSCTPEHLMQESYLLNLDVNFVNNYRMRIGDYETALQAFQDVILRYPDHAFAYYYMAKCASKLFRKKMKEHPEWNEYAEYFGVL